MKNILELLENSEKLYPDKTAVSDGKRTITYSRFKTAAMETGSYPPNLNSNAVLSPYIWKKVLKRLFQ